MDIKILEQEIYDKCGEFSTVYECDNYKIVETEMNEDGQISFITVGLSNNEVNIMSMSPEVFKSQELVMTIDSTWLTDDYDSNKVIKTLRDLADFIIGPDFEFRGFGTRFNSNGTVYETNYASFFLYFSLNFQFLSQEVLILQLYPLYKEEDRLFQSMSLDLFTKYYFTYKYSTYKRANLYYAIRFDDIKLYETDDENAFILPSMLFSWLIYNDLVNDEFKETNTELIDFVKQCKGLSDLREVVKENISFIFSPALYTIEGIDFLLFYCLENETHNLISDALDCAKELEHSEINPNETRSFFKFYSDELIETMYSKIDKAFKEYCEINYFDGYNYGEEQ